MRDNGSISLLVQYLVSPDMEALSRSDCRLIELGKAFMIVKRYLVRRHQNQDLYYLAAVAIVLEEILSDPISNRRWTEDKLRR